MYLCLGCSYDCTHVIINLGYAWVVHGLLAVLYAAKFSAWFDCTSGMLIMLLCSLTF
jgi:hypothetical protein